MKINILYEDENLLALDKPAGLLVHSDGRSKEKTLVDWLDENYPDLKEVGEEQVLQNGEKIKRPGIVHRLDRDTSGVIIVAKTKAAFEFLKEQFQNRKVQKIYHAVVWGNFSDDKKEGVIDKSIGRSSSDFRKWSAEYGAKGELREAVTEYKVLAQRSFSEVELAQNHNPPYLKGETGKKLNNNYQGFSYLEVRPKTGRTHQIRVHLKSISHPVLGDKLYGSKNKNDAEFFPLNFNRLALHAFAISFESLDGTHITVESPLPKEFEEAKKVLT